VELLDKWAKIREIRSDVQKEIERQREAGKIGASLQAVVSLKVNQSEYDLLSTLKGELRNVFITSEAHLQGVSSQREILVTPSSEKKCERCWQYSATVGSDSDYPTLCCRCVGNLFKQPETREFA
jgi:isoleucyl-tRNA synthetase